MLSRACARPLRPAPVRLCRASGCFFQQRVLRPCAQQAPASSTGQAPFSSTAARRTDNGGRPLAEDLVSAPLADTSAAGTAAEGSSPTPSDGGSQATHPPTEQHSSPDHKTQTVNGGESGLEKEKSGRDTSKSKKSKKSKKALPAQLSKRQLRTQIQKQNKAKGRKDASELKNESSGLVRKHWSAAPDELDSESPGVNFDKLEGHSTLAAALDKSSPKSEKKQKKKGEQSTKRVQTVSARAIEFTPLSREQPPVPALAYGLDRVLFNPGVYFLQDERTRVYNFDPYLQKIMPIADFDFDALTQYITSSEDLELSRMASEYGKKYVGSTSSMTGVLSHFHYLLSNFRPLNHNKMISKGFHDETQTFTALNRAPGAIYLRWKNGSYAIDADKAYDTPNVLSMLGRSMEKLLTLPKDEYERYRRINSDGISEEERNSRESYQYSTQGDFLMRSQLDAQDPRLPGTGHFDLKTRAVAPIRHNIRNYEVGTGYQITEPTGDWESFEREFFDMTRSTMLKYSLQARMGNMDGIFVAYHNIERMFGFQYFSIDDMDRILHGPAANYRRLGDQEFRLSIDLLNQVLDKATQRFPETSIQLHFETRPGTVPFMYIFAEPMTEEEAENLQNGNKKKIVDLERQLLGLEPIAPETEMSWDDVRDQVEQEMAKDEDVVKEDGDTEHKEDISDTQVRSVDDMVSPQPQGERSISSDDAGQREDLAFASAKSDDVSSDTNETSEDHSGNVTGDEERNPSDEAKDILAMHLTVRNKVNGQYVVRPEMINPTSDWTLEYELEEIQGKEAARAKYEACKKRRFRAFATSVEESMAKMNGEDVEVHENLSFYQRRLRELSVKGRMYRERQDKKYGHDTPVVYQPLGRSADADADAGTSSSITDVDSYMKWLYQATGTTSADAPPAEPEERSGNSEVGDYMSWLYSGKAN